MKILITGSSGQLAKEFVKLFTVKKTDFLAPSEKELDITNRSDISAITKKYKPTHIINCAAFNLLDDAEENPDKAFLVNRDAVELLALESNEIGAEFIHFSTDYVFDGEKKDFYVENDKTNPINKYALSKYEGEEKAKLADKNLILRLSWVIGEGKQNFLFKLSQWAQNSKTLKISADEVSVPSFTFDIANTTLKAVKTGLNGIYHLTNSGYASRYELAKKYIELKNMDNVLLPVPSESFGLKTKRPLFTPMSNKLISSSLGIKIPSWEESLERFCKEYDYKKS